MASKEIEQRIQNEFYDAAWRYRTHAGYDQKAEEAAFTRYRVRRLRELGFFKALFMELLKGNVG